MSKHINIFDFDGTLTTETWPKFWVWVKKFGYNGDRRNDELEDALADYRKNNNGSYLETFFAFFNDLLEINKTSITYDELMEGEKYIVYNPGVLKYLEESKEKNYIVSGGLKEFLEYLNISKYFEGIYGTPVIHDDINNISGIGEVMSDEKKVDAIRDILKQNGRINDDCRDVYFIGDGFSDAASMRFVHEHGGSAIFVYPSNKDDTYYEYNMSIYEKLNKDNIVDYCVEANYEDNSKLKKLLTREYEYEKKDN